MPRRGGLPSGTLGGAEPSPANPEKTALEFPSTDAVIWLSDGRRPPSSLETIRLIDLAELIISPLVALDLSHSMRFVAASNRRAIGKQSSSTSWALMTAVYHAGMWPTERTMKNGPETRLTE
jgi:hypothetical protein